LGIDGTSYNELSMKMAQPTRLLITAALVFAAVLVASAQRRDVFVQSRLVPAINYDAAEANDPVARLNKQLAAGTVTLKFEADNGYLRSVLAALDIPVESQGLVFSQTSFEGKLINVKNPRALYFNDTTALGWVRGSGFLEIAGQDPKQGMIFYTLDQKQSSKPRFERNNDCLSCHLSWENLGVPGLMVQSVNPLPDEYAYVVGYNNNHASPFSQRFGGWYVTGTYGGIRHMGNISVMPEDKGKLKVPNPFELATVQGLFDPKGYPTLYSDASALLVLAHQVAMTNHITRLGWEARVAAATPSEDARARVKEAAQDFVDYLLFVDEEPLRSPVRGMSGFVEKFSAQGPRDSKGRSLHTLDLQTRLLKYPCSYMIYTEAFDNLPPAAKDAVYARMWQILSGAETGRRYTRLKPADRTAVIEILRETKKDLPVYFKG
jgi:hypothetical protein